MATRIGCCLNLPPPPTNPTNYFPPKTTQLPIRSSKRKVEEDQGRRSVPRAIGVASAVIIGLEMINSINAVESQYAIAEQVTTTMPQKRQQPPKWSDKRTCPPWRVNSLESIVPENLPRPTARRRWGTVGYSAAAGAPPVRFYLGRLTGDCFSM